MTGILIIKRENACQFQDLCFVFWEIGPLFPAEHSTAMHPKGISQLLLGTMPAKAQGFHKRPKGCVVIGQGHRSGLLPSDFQNTSVLLQNAAAIAPWCALYFYTEMIEETSHLAKVERPGRNILHYAYRRRFGPCSLL